MGQEICVLNAMASFILFAVALNEITSDGFKESIYFIKYFIFANYVTHDEKTRFIWNTSYVLTVIFAFVFSFILFCDSCTHLIVK